MALPASSANTSTTFDFACSAMLDGRPFALGGLVVADAEQSRAAESVQATVASSATWRIVDRLRSPGCNASTAAGRTDDGVTNTLVLAGSTVCASGPAVVAYADGATSGSATIRSTSTGRTVVSFGVLVPIDRGDAPATYGEAAHAIAPTLDGGAPPAPGPTAVNDPAFSLASPTAPPTRLGASVDPGGAASADAGGDDVTGSDGTFGADDDESEVGPAPITVEPGSGFSRTVACTGPGFVAGWIDFDASGAFDADERSKTAACASGSAELTWTVSAAVRSQTLSFERLRIAASPEDVVAPAGFAATGEVEDHAITLAVAAPPALAPPPTAAQSPLDSRPRAAPPAPQPDKNASVVAGESTGIVLVRTPGSPTTIALTDTTEIPLGSHVDTRAGRVVLTAEVDVRSGATESASFYDGIFVVTQTPGPNPILEAKLTGGSFAGCSSATAATAALGHARGTIPFQFAARRRGKRPVRRLWGKGKGNFRTEGQRSSATVRGTWWLVEDYCDSTFTRVRQGRVDVRDFARKRTVRLRAGKRYLYRAPRA